VGGVSGFGRYDTSFVCSSHADIHVMRGQYKVDVSFEKEEVQTKLWPLALFAFCKDAVLGRVVVGGVTWTIVARTALETAFACERDPTLHARRSCGCSRGNDGLEEMGDFQVGRGRCLEPPQTRGSCVLFSNGSVLQSLPLRVI
jgi:hypothetical protein